MEIGLFDKVKVVRLIQDEQQLQEIEFAEAQEAFCSAACRWHDTKQQGAMENVTELCRHAFCTAQHAEPLIIPEKFSVGPKRSAVRNRRFRVG